MGLPPNLLGVLGLTFDRFWGSAAPTTRFTAAEPSVASTGVGVMSLAGQVAPATATTTGVRSPAACLWTAVTAWAGAFIAHVQDARMRKAMREIAQIRSRLHVDGAPEGPAERRRAVACD